MNWDNLEKDAGQDKRNNYKDYAPHGTHQVVFDHAEITDKDTWKSPRVVFFWADDEKYKYPRSYAHWLSMKNPAWRAVHNRNILMAMGIDQNKAQQLVEAAEKNQDRDKLVKGYEAMYKRVAERKPKVDITIQDQYDRDGKQVLSPNGTPYSESDFTDRGCRMMEAPKEAPTIIDPLEDAEDVEDIDLTDIPF